jgi:Rps23 Pro-64 3,4-dihydroxylase Tpa1-like proline 4-hydroxylase
MVFDFEKLMRLAEENGQKYQTREPFPYMYFDDVVDVEALKTAFASFPVPDETFYQYSNPLEKKFAKDNIHEMPEPIKQILMEMNSPLFLLFLEKLTGIDGLIPDPYYRGGGIHCMGPGCKLDIHVDFNKHPKLKLDRRINVLLFPVEEWRPEWNGDFQVWKGKLVGNHHELTEMADRVYPQFNRMVLFSTSEKSYHGVPEVISCPDGVYRYSLATYYYTYGRNDIFQEWQPHSTTYIKRPGENDELDELREKRNSGRLNSNTKGLIN